MQRFSFVALLIAAAAFAAVAAHAGDLGQSPAPAASAAYDPAALPSGDLGDSIKLGREIIMNTQQMMPGYVRAKFECASCHVDGGTVPKGGSFIGTASYFPQYNRRANRIITLQDRLAECFLYSMNGRPPNYASKANGRTRRPISRGFRAERRCSRRRRRRIVLSNRCPPLRRTSRTARRSTSSSVRCAIRPAAPASPVHFRRCGATRPSTTVPGWRTSIV